MLCPKCGTNVPENVRFCPTCGEPVNKSKPIFDERDHTSMFDSEDIKRTRILAIFCYVSTLFIIVGLLAAGLKSLSVLMSKKEEASK